MKKLQQLKKYKRSEEGKGKKNRTEKGVEKRERG
jgi:hypothetical protein